MLFKWQLSNFNCAQGHLDDSSPNVLLNWFYSIKNTSFEEIIISKFIRNIEFHKKPKKSVESFFLEHYRISNRNDSNRLKWMQMAPQGSGKFYRCERAPTNTFIPYTSTHTIKATPHYKVAAIFAYTYERTSSTFLVWHATATDIFDSSTKGDEQPIYFSSRLFVHRMSIQNLTTFDPFADGKRSQFHFQFGAFSSFYLKKSD